MSTTFFQCSKCHSTLAQSEGIFACQSCWQGAVLTDDKRSQSFWDIRSHFYESLLPVTTLLGKGKFRYHYGITQLVETMGPYSKTDRILDVATGTGLVIRELSKHCQPDLLAGIDFSRSMLQKAVKQCANLGQPIYFVQGDAHHLPFPSNTFNKILCAGALSNFHTPIQALREIHRVLEPKGKAGFLVNVTAPEKQNHLFEKFLLTLYKMCGASLQEINVKNLEEIMVQTNLTLRWIPLGGAWSLILAENRVGGK